MSKKIIMGTEARNKIINGINLLANTVKTTLGPKGQYAIIDMGFGKPSITNDGVNIAKNISLKDNAENLGAKLLIEATEKTDSNVGDGTTTTAILTQSLINKGNKLIASGFDPNQIIEGIKLAKTQALNFIQEVKIDIKSSKEITSIATISSKDAKIGQIISEIIQKVGKDGKVTVERGNKFFTETDIIKGLHFDEGFASRYMITEKNEKDAIYTNAKVLIYDGKIDNIRSIITLLEEVLKEGKPLVIMANEFSEEFLGTMLLNSVQGGIKFLGVKNPGFGESKRDLLEDIAIYLGTQVIEENGPVKLKDLKLDKLGSAGKIKSSKTQTIILEGGGSKQNINQRIELLKAALVEDSTDDELQKRLAKLSGGIGIIKVGGATETQADTDKLKYEDALNSTIAALENGIIEGGGLTLAKAAEKVQKTKRKVYHNPSFELFEETLYEPLKQIARNSGVSGRLALAKIKEQELAVGFDGNTRKYVDMMKTGIIDPANVAISAIENATSIACLVLLTDLVVTEDKIEGKNDQPQ